MSETNTLNFDTLLEILAEKLAILLTHEPGRLYPRLLTIDQAAVYLGRTREAMQHLVTGARLGELRSLRWKQLDLKAGRITLDPRRKTRTAALCRFTAR